MATEPSERDQLIARAQELGITAPWFRSTADLQSEIAGHETAGIPATPAADYGPLPETETEEPLAADDPRAGTPDDPGVSDPYAHLAKPAEEEVDEG
jgi:hypothetical protein